MTRPEVSIIIPWRNRTELSTTLTRNAPEFQANRSEVVVVNCGGRRSLLGGLLRRAPVVADQIHIASRHFNKPLAINLGVLGAKSHRVLLLDSDIVLPRGVLAAMKRRLTHSSFVTIARAQESSPRPVSFSYLEEMGYWTHLVAAGRKVRIETNRVRFADGTRSAPGVVLVSRHHFIRVGGMNSELVGWGWEDIDLLVRLQFALNLAHRRVGKVLHLTHAQDSRKPKASQQQTQQANMTACIVNYGNGRLTGTYALDSRTWAHKGFATGRQVTYCRRRRSAVGRPGRE